MEAKMAGLAYAAQLALMGDAISDRVSVPAWAVRLVVEHGDLLLDERHPSPMGGEPHQSDLMNAALGALATPEKIGWRPIETAPRDGTEVLIFVPMHEGSPYIGFDAFFDGQWHNDADEEATHWMPLPAPPQPDERPQPSSAATAHASP